MLNFDIARANYSTQRGRVKVHIRNRNSKLWIQFSLPTSPYLLSQVQSWNDHIYSFLPNWPKSMILMVVIATDSVDDIPSMHFTTVPFRSLLTLSIVTLDTSGRMFWPESLEKVIMEVPILSGWGIPLTPSAEMGVGLWVTFSGKTVNSHLWTPSDVLHVSSSWSPTWQTGATSDGEISTTPAK